MQARPRQKARQRAPERAGGLLGGGRVQFARQRASLWPRHQDPARRRTRGPPEDGPFDGKPSSARSHSGRVKTTRPPPPPARERAAQVEASPERRSGEDRYLLGRLRLGRRPLGRLRRRLGLDLRLGCAAAALASGRLGGRLDQVGQIGGSRSRRVRRPRPARGTGGPLDGAHPAAQHALRNPPRSSAGRRCHARRRFRTRRSYQGRCSN